jgi:hypothetical protein
MKSFMVVVLAIAFSGAAWALEDTPANRNSQANRYLKATPPKEMFRDAAEQIARKLPPKDQQTFIDLMTKYLAIDSLSKAMKDAMIKYFTADEIKALADFYGSEVGKSVMKKFGAYQAEILPALHAEILKAQAKANRKMSEANEQK